MYIGVRKGTRVCILPESPPEFAKNTISLLYKSIVHLESMAERISWAVEKASVSYDLDYEYKCPLCNKTVVGIPKFDMPEVEQLFYFLKEVRENVDVLIELDSEVENAVVLTMGLPTTIISTYLETGEFDPYERYHHHISAYKEGECLSYIPDKDLVILFDIFDKVIEFYYNGEHVTEISYEEVFNESPENRLRILSAIIYKISEEIQ